MFLTISHNSRSQATQAGTLGAWCAGSVQMRNAQRDVAAAARRYGFARAGADAPQPWRLPLCSVRARTVRAAIRPAATWLAGR